MRFANVTSARLRFDIAGVWYECSPGECVDIPDKVAFAVESRGLSLVPASDVEPEPSKQPAPPARSYHFAEDDLRAPEEPAAKQEPPAKPKRGR